MHASYVAILVLAASAASPALSAPLAPDPLFQSIPTIDRFGNLGVTDLNNIHIVNKPDSSPALVVGARSIFGDVFSTILGLFGGGGDSGILLGRDGVNSVRGIFGRQCGTSLFSGNQTFLPPVGSCDLDALIADLQNFQRDVASRLLNSFD
ncbi:hypothetical protein EDB87DRAFT_1577435 [Lactarius vividus]|nr:hypothetical protein EDB87DRAFT_1577435 [Lactarius vividus]